jgi:hypothetical protein
MAILTPKALALGYSWYSYLCVGSVRRFKAMRVGIFCGQNTVNREIFAALKVGEFAFFQLAVDKIPRLLQKFNG